MGLFDGIFGSGGANDLKKALEGYEDVTLPELKRLNPELYQQVIELNPELETAVNLGPSAMEGVSTDPAMKQAQMEALRKLQGIGSGERTLSDEANLTRIENEVNRNLKGNQDAIMQNLATRGMSGGGNELVARQMATQSAANRQADMDMRVRAEAEQRALQALMQSGQLAGQMEQQDYNRKANVAQNQDAISRFNAQNQQNVKSRNVATRNNAQQWNAQNTQSTANQNTGLRNQYDMYNEVERKQNNYQNQLRLADSKAGIHQAIASDKNAKRDREANFIGGLAGAGATAFASDKNVKENISKLDSAEFLKYLNGYEYDYQNPEKHGEGPQVGIMAQELEKVAPQAVMTDEEGVKRVDQSKLTGPVLALLADINKRLEKVEEE